MRLGKLLDDVIFLQHIFCPFLCKSKCFIIGMILAVMFFIWGTEMHDVRFCDDKRIDERI